MLQFHALDCVDLSTPADYFIEHGYVLRVDTSVDCNSNAYKNFVVANCLLIVIYQSVPLVWFCLLWRVRHLLDPMGYAKSARHPEVSELDVKNDSEFVDSDELGESDRKGTRSWLEQFSQLTGLRSSVNQARISQAYINDSNKLSEKELAAKARLRLDTDKRATEVVIDWNFIHFENFKSDHG